MNTMHSSAHAPQCAALHRVAPSEASPSANNVNTRAGRVAVRRAGGGGRTMQLK
jgi:predicted metal-dependent hydrolase